MTIIRYIFLSLALCGFGWSAYGQDNTPKYSNEFLALGVGARAFGMGSIGASTADDVTAGYWNPAGLMRMQPDYQGMFMHSSYFGGIASYDYAAVAASVLDSSKIALSVIRFAVDDIPDTRFLFDANGAIDYNRIRFFSASDYAFLLSYAQGTRFLGGLNMGGSVKIIHRQVGDFARAWGFGVDLGAQKRWRSWQFGVSARDIFGTFNAWNHNPDELREIYNATNNDVPLNTLEITLPRLVLAASREFVFLDHFSVLTSIELQATFDGKRNTVIKSDFASIDPIIGTEIGYKDLLFLRFGAGQFQKVTELSGEGDWKYLPSGGLGFKIRELAIDYALTDVGDQAEGLYSHVFSIKVDFHAKDD